MDFNIQIQIASLVFILAIFVLYLTKPKSHNAQNRIFLRQLILAVFLVSCDIVSCIFIALKETYPAWNDVFGKGYIVLMLFWLSSIMDYLFATIRHEKMSHKFNGFLTVSRWIIFGLAGVFTVLTLCLDEFYFHEGRVVYSYGIPSVCTYIYSAVLAVLFIILVVINWRYLPLRKKVPCIAYCFASGIPALFQSIFPEYLLLSLGCGVTELIMYMALENPDIEYATRIETLNMEKMDLFHNVVPEFIAEKLNYKLSSYYEELPEVCIGYVKIKNFTEIVSAKGLEKTTSILNKVYQAFDSTLDNYGIEKVKISGDTYEVVSGLSGSSTTDCHNMISFLNAVRTIISGISLGNEVPIKASCGVTFGPVAVCMMGNKRLSFDLLSSTAELGFLVAMECEPERILVTESVMKRTNDIYEYHLTETNKLSDFGISYLYYLYQKNQ